MAVSIQDVDNIVNSTLPHYLKGKALRQNRQEMPLLNKLRGKKKTYPGGNNFEIRRNVKGNPDTDFGFQVFADDDPVSYGNPTRIKQPVYVAREHHIGMKVLFTELKKQGIEVVDTTAGNRVSNITASEVVQITNLLEEKFDDLDYAADRSLNNYIWRDGTQAANAIVGILGLISPTPTVGITGGLDRASLTYWRNRSFVGASKINISSNYTAGTGQFTLKAEMRQLTRYGGRPDIAMSGSTAIQLLEREMLARGQMTQTGYDKTLSLGIGDLVIPGVGTIQYDPTLDDLGYADYLFLLDSNNGPRLQPVAADDMKIHTPSRPAEVYAMYRGITLTTTLTAWQLNSSGVYQIG
ncbi:Phage major capsid protein [uncultured Gammaproteobacteria bacterium]